MNENVKPMYHAVDDHGTRRHETTDFDACVKWAFDNLSEPFTVLTTRNGVPSIERSSEHMVRAHEYIGLRATDLQATAACVYQKLEEALQMIQTIKVNEGSDAHKRLLAASNSVWDAQLHVGKFMSGE